MSKAAAAPEDHGANGVEHQPMVEKKAERCSHVADDEQSGPGGEKEGVTGSSDKRKMAATIASSIASMPARLISDKKAAGKDGLDHVCMQAAQREIYIHRYGSEIGGSRGDVGDDGNFPRKLFGPDLESVPVVRCRKNLRQNCNGASPPTAR